MFYTLANSPFGFWAVAFLFVACDSVLFLCPSEFTFSFGEKLSVRLRIPKNPFLLLHKQSVVTLLLYPATPFFITAADEAIQGRRATKRLLLQQKRLAVHSRQLANIALIPLVLISVVGPIASLQYGIDRAMLMVIPALYVCAIFVTALMWLRRADFGFSRRDAWHIALELAICPILIINIFKRIALRQRRVCTTDLINHFSDNQAAATERLKRHVEATAK